MEKMRYDFDQIIDRRGTASVKWQKYQGRDILPMWVADMDFRSPPQVIKALHDRVEHGIFGYTLPPHELTDIIISRMRELYGWQVEHDWLVWLPGLVPGLNIACRAVGKRGDQVVTMTPVYPPFLSAPGNVGRELITVPLADTPTGWRLDFDGLAQAITPSTRLLLLCHPHNPVGRIWSQEELFTLAAICREKNLIVCSDEIHCDLILARGKRHQPFATIDPEAADRTVTLMAPSKTFNIPGLGCSFAIIGNDTLRRSFKRAMADLVPFVNTLGFTAALAAYKEGEEWLIELLEYLRQNLGLVEKAVSGLPGVSMHPVEATYLAWLNVRELGLKNPALFFEEQAGVGLSDGREFGNDGFLRLNFACPRTRLVEGLERIQAAISRL